MATIHDLIEVTGISAHTTYSIANGNLLGVVDNVTSSALNDGEFDEGDDIFIGGVSYNIDEIEEPSSSGRFTLGDGSVRTFDAGSEYNLDVAFLTVSNGGDVRYFIIPNDSYGDMDIEEIRTGGINGAAGSDAAVISTSNNDVNIVCFTQDTMIESAKQRQTPVQKLRVGDLVKTADNGLQRIKWIGVSKLDRETLMANPNLRPIRIKPGALGNGTPHRGLRVSPQHRILVRSKIAQRMFGRAEVLIAAKHLTALDGIDVVNDPAPTDYYHLLLDSHHIVTANGAACESLYLGAQALKHFDDDTRRDISQELPLLCRLGHSPPPCRPLVSGPQGRKLAQRHRKHSTDLIAPAKGATGIKAKPSQPAVLSI